MIALFIIVLMTKYAHAPVSQHDTSLIIRLVAEMVSMVFRAEQVDEAYAALGRVDDNKAIVSYLLDQQEHETVAAAAAGSQLAIEAGAASSATGLTAEPASSALPSSFGGHIDVGLDVNLGLDEFDE